MRLEGKPVATLHTTWRMRDALDCEHPSDGLRRSYGWDRSKTAEYIRPSQYQQTSRAASTTADTWCHIRDVTVYAIISIEGSSSRNAVCGIGANLESDADRGRWSALCRDLHRVKTSIAERQSVKAALEAEQLHRGHEVLIAAGEHHAERTGTLTASHAALASDGDALAAPRRHAQRRLGRRQAHGSVVAHRKQVGGGRVALLLRHAIHYRQEVR